MKPYPLVIFWNQSFDPGFTTPGHMGIKVSLGQKKLKIFLKLRPSEIVHFEDKVSGINNNFTFWPDTAYFGLEDPSKSKNSVKNGLKKIFFGDMKWGAQNVRKVKGRKKVIHVE